MDCRDTTIAIVLDAEHLAEWQLTLPTWFRWHPEIAFCRWLIFAETPQIEMQAADLFAPLWGAVLEQSEENPGRNWCLLPWGDTPPECDTQRKRALWQYLVHVPRAVETSRWVKIDTDVVGVAHETGAAWLGLGKDADVTGSPWGYTKPAGALSKLESWLGSRILHRQQPDRDKCPRLIGWLASHSTQATRCFAASVTEDIPPVISHDTLTWFLAGDNWAPYPYARFGWRHVSKRHLAAAVAASDNPLPSIPPHSQSVVDLIESLGPKCSSVVEIGCFQGQTSHAILSRCPKVQLTMVDPWAEFERDGEYYASGDNRAKQSQAEHDRAYEVAMAATELFADRRTVCRTDSMTSARELPTLKQTFDLGFIDGDHTKRAVAADCEAWYPLIRPGGILCGHDYGHRRFHGVKQAVNEFAKAHRLEVRLHPGTVWSVRKP